ncbi:uncharacterized protein BX663DRAFT_554029 [Cokeromyces recurvatus]|uniref:uncharacterized protein n=1 Tax=Cokeromyces recurvatus TaxID=90255 RepID=UPI002220593A|nr:uncharacterized protein BX663DRAFT_554029 [Cokeromyces recurvatus]KAI7900420.1 hypothetical protein BX663DRAFT_554029 [Cokeromyces recurvatus]
MRPSLCNSSNSRENDVRKYNSDTQINKMEKIDFFQFNVTEPSSPTKKNNQIKKCWVIMEKLADQIKKIKQQASHYRTSHHDSDMNNPFVFLETSSYFRNSIEFSYIFNYSEVNGFRQSFILNPDDGQRAVNKVKHKNGKSRIKQQQTHFKREKKSTNSLMMSTHAKNLINSYVSFTLLYIFASKSQFVPATKDQRKSQFQFNCLYQQQPQITLVDNNPKALLKIRQQILDFEIPADWTRIPLERLVDKKANKHNDYLYPKDAFDLIKNLRNKKKNIEIQIKRIEESKESILEYKIKLDMLEQNSLQVM